MGSHAGRKGVVGEQRERDESNACTHNGRDLLDRHLAIVAEAERKGRPEIAEQANEIWSLHEAAVAALNDILEAASEGVSRCSL